MKRTKWPKTMVLNNTQRNHVYLVSERTETMSVMMTQRIRLSDVSYEGKHNSSYVARRPHLTPVVQKVGKLLTDLLQNFWGVNKLLILLCSSAIASLTSQMRYNYQFLDNTTWLGSPYVCEEVNLPVTGMKSLKYQQTNNFIFKQPECIYLMSNMTTNYPQQKQAMQLRLQHLWDSSKLWFYLYSTVTAPLSYEMTLN